MPAEAGFEERAISFTKGCYPGQEPVASLHYRGHPNRGLRVLTLEGTELPEYDAELTLDGKVVGRVTSAAMTPTTGWSRWPTFVARCHGGGARSRRSGGAAAALVTQCHKGIPVHSPFPRARSSGDRALPCGGRGRKFESCRAHAVVPAHAGTARPRDERLRRHIELTRWLAPAMPERV